MESRDQSSTSDQESREVLCDTSALADVFGFTSFQNCEFDGCTFRPGMVSAFHFHECRLVECAFEHCNLKRTKFTNSQFNSVRIVRCRVLGQNQFDGNKGRPHLLSVILEE